MYSLMEQLNHYLQIFLYLLILVCFVAGGCYIYYAKVAKKRRISEDEMDYSHLNREDSVDYIKFDDIKDGMVILNHGRRFVGAVRGEATRDFYEEQVQIQASVAQNFESFIGTIDRPTTFRQHCQAVDMEDTINAYKEQLSNREKELYNAVEDRREIVAALERNTLTKEEMDEYTRSLEQLDRQIESLKIRKFHIEDQINYIKCISGAGVDPLIVQNWLFEWIYDPLDFSIDLSEEEIYKRAVQELKAKANAYIHALSNCGVKAVRCTTEDLIEMSRRYSCPISSERFKLRDVVNSSFFDDINTSDCVDELMNEAAMQNSSDAADMLFDSIINSLQPVQEANDVRVSVGEEQPKRELKKNIEEKVSAKHQDVKKKNVARRVKKRTNMVSKQSETKQEDKTILYLDE